MKKSLIPILLTIATFVGCAKSQTGGNADTTSVAPSDKVIVRGAITSQIMPPGAANQPIQVTTQIGRIPNLIQFSGTFAGQNTQTVTITGPGGLNQQFSSTAGLNWGPFTTPAPLNPGDGGGWIVVRATDIGSAYTNYLNAPKDNPNYTGSITTTYSDGVGNSSVINVYDTGNPAVAKTESSKK